MLHPAIVGRRPYQTVPLPIYDAPSPLLAYKDPRVLIGLSSAERQARLRYTRVSFAPFGPGLDLNWRSDAMDRA